VTQRVLRHDPEVTTKAKKQTKNVVKIERKEAEKKIFCLHFCGGKSARELKYNATIKCC
jgi:hypothetical protein